MLASANAFAFPELPFCPLGGPPGWFNRMTPDNDRYYGPPPVRGWYPAPYPPVYQPGYLPVYPVGPVTQPIYRVLETGH